MNKSFQIPPFVGCPFVEGTPSKHVGLYPPLAVKRKNNDDYVHTLSVQLVTSSRYKSHPATLRTRQKIRSVAKEVF